MRRKTAENQHRGTVSRAGNGTLRTLPGSVDYAPPLSLMTRHIVGGPRQRPSCAFAACMAELSAPIAWLVSTQAQTTI
jgi:hypothetical protein